VTYVQIVRPEGGLYYRGGTKGAGAGTRTTKQNLIPGLNWSSGRRLKVDPGREGKIWRKLSGTARETGSLILPLSLIFEAPKRVYFAVKGEGSGIGC